MEKRLKKTKKYRIKLGWGLTHLCNMRCIFCYSWKIRQNQERWNLENSQEFINQNKKIIEDINWGTGENVLLPWFPSLVEYVSNKKIPQSLTTNGSVSLLNEKSKDKIYSFIDEIDISVDFPNSLLHNRYRGYEKAYQIAIKTVKEAKEYGIKTSIVSVLGNFNANSKYFRKLLGIAAKNESFLRINLLVPTYKGLRDFLAPISTIFSIFKWLFKNAYVASISDYLVYSMFSVEKKLPNFSKFLEYPGKSYRILPDGFITPNTYLISKKWRIDNVLGKKLKVQKLIRSKKTAYFINVAKKERKKNFGGAFERVALSGSDCYLKFEFFESIYINKPIFNKILNRIKIEGENIDIYPLKSKTIHSEYLATTILKPM